MQCAKTSLFIKTVVKQWTLRQLTWIHSNFQKYGNNMTWPGKMFSCSQADTKYVVDKQTKTAWNSKA